jgi:hypothetical protein
MGCLMEFYTSLTLFYTKMSFKNPEDIAYHTILKLADHALFKMVTYVLLQALRPKLDGQLDK